MAWHGMIWLDGMLDMAQIMYHTDMDNPIKNTRIYKWHPTSEAGTAATAW